MRTCIVLSLFVALGYLSIVHAQRDVTLAAGYGHRGNLILMDCCHEYLTVGPNNFQWDKQSRHGRSQLPKGAIIKAGAGLTKDWMLFYAFYNYYYTNRVTGKTTRVEYNSNHQSFIKNGGPDAAGTRRGVRYVFKGCQYVTTRHISDLRKERAKNIKDLNVNLPCDIDAAWTTNQKEMYVVKGDQLWIWGDTVEGPMPFSSKFHLYSWQLKPRPESRLLL